MHWIRLAASRAAPLSSGFTALGNKAVFAALNAKGKIGLWLTNGTAAGTGELKIAGADLGGLSPKYFPVLEITYCLMGTTPTVPSSFG